MSYLSFFVPSGALNVPLQRSVRAVWKSLVRGDGVAMSQASSYELSNASKAVLNAGVPCISATASSQDSWTRFLPEQVRSLMQAALWVTAARVSAKRSRDGAAMGSRDGAAMV